MPHQRHKPEDLKPGPIRHQQLPPSLIARIEALHATLEEVFPMSLAEWLDGFQRDAHPEGEVAWWERLARCYVEYAQHQELQGEQRQAAFNVICKLGLGASALNLAADLANLPPGALDDVLAICVALPVNSASTPRNSRAPSGWPIRPKRELKMLVKISLVS